MANVTSFMDDLLKPFASGFAKATNKVDSNKPVSLIDALRQAAESRMFLENGQINSKLVEAAGGKVKRFKHGRKAEFNYKSGQEGGFNKGDVLKGPESAKIDDWMRAKSLFYDREGDLKYGRVAGAAVGFGGGAIATLNLGYDMIT